MAQLIVALDYTNAEDALATAESLRGCPIWMKVGLELFTHEGPAVVKKLKDMGFKVMLDLKMFDIPNTVAGGVRSACLMGVDLITLHALGGERMIHAAVDAVKQSAEEGGPKPLLFAVTVLTSMAPGELPGYGEDLSGLAADIERVHVQRIQDASPRRMAFQKKIGAGQTLAEFEASRQAGRLRHVGLPESVYFVGAALGWELTRVTESIEPVVAEADLALPGAIPVKAGQARGVRQFGRGFAGDREVITLEFVAAIGEPGSTDRVHIFGTPELDSVISGGVNGDKGTCAITLNAARHIAGSRQVGLLTMLDIPPITGHSR